MRTINRDELRRKMQESPGRTLLVDVRDKDDYEREHIAGAISIPMSELVMRAEKGFGREQEIIVYCAGFECPASQRAAEILDKRGFSNAVCYAGGLADWKTAGFLTEGKETLKAA